MASRDKNAFTMDNGPRRAPPVKYAKRIKHVRDLRATHRRRSRRAENYPLGQSQLPRRTRAMTCADRLTRRLADQTIRRVARAVFPRAQISPPFNKRPPAHILWRRNSIASSNLDTFRSDRDAVPPRPLRSQRQRLLANSRSLTKKKKKKKEKKKERKEQTIAQSRTLLDVRSLLISISPAMVNSDVLLNSPLKPVAVRQPLFARLHSPRAAYGGRQIEICRSASWTDENATGRNYRASRCGFRENVISGFAKTYLQRDRVLASGDVLTTRTTTCPSE
jgi:hypothetical protein